MHNHQTGKRIFHTMRFGVALLTIFVILGCGSYPAATTELALQYAVALHKSIEQFEETRVKTAEQMGSLRDTVDEVLDTAQQLHRENDALPAPVSPVSVELTGMSKTWEAKWRSVGQEYSQLQKHFSEVGVRSDAYFLQLELITEQIYDDGWRTTQQRENDALKREWTLAYAQAAAQINQLEALIRIGDDIDKVLRLSALRASLNEDLRQLQSISVHAQVLLEQLEQLTQEGRRLTAGG